MVKTIEFEIELIDETELAHPVQDEGFVTVQLYDTGIIVVSQVGKIELLETFTVYGEQSMESLVTIEQTGGVITQMVCV